MTINKFPLLKRTIALNIHKVAVNHSKIPWFWAPTAKSTLNSPRSTCLEICNSRRRSSLWLTAWLRMWMVDGCDNMGFLLMVNVICIFVAYIHGSVMGYGFENLWIIFYVLMHSPDSKSAVKIHEEWENPWAKNGFSIVMGIPKMVGL